MAGMETPLPSAIQEINLDKALLASGYTCVQVPATSANLGPGFDSFGMALSCYNRFYIRKIGPHEGPDRVTGHPDSSVDLTSCLQDSIEDSILFQSLEKFYSRLGQPRPAFDIIIEGHIPPARGLGSSASAVVGALVGANRLEETPLDEQTLGALATAMEGHPDNVIPALVGGVTLCNDDAYYSLPWPQDWGITVVIPSYPVSTAAARKVLPQEYPRQDAVFNVQKASLLVYALFQQDSSAFAKSLDDKLHQPYRKSLIREFQDVQQRAAQVGAFGTVISGSGPTIAIFHPQSVGQTLHQSLLDYRENTTPKGDFSIHSLNVVPAGTTLPT